MCLYAITKTAQKTTTPLLVYKVVIVQKDDFMHGRTRRTVVSSFYKGYSYSMLKLHKHGERIIPINRGRENLMIYSGFHSWTRLSSAIEFMKSFPSAMLLESTTTALMPCIIPTGTNIVYGTDGDVEPSIVSDQIIPITYLGDLRDLSELDLINKLRETDQKYHAQILMQHLKLPYTILDMLVEIIKKGQSND